MADEVGLTLAELLPLSFEYELWMDRSAADKCTGFVSLGVSGQGPMVLGQTNDEDPDEWDQGRTDLVVRHRGATAEGDTLIYSHPGIPAYMGINAAGLVCLWQYIDDGERDPDGVPTTALIREALTKTSVDAAAEFLRETPRAVPNNFILGGHTGRARNIECSPTRFTTTLIEEDAFCHTNHVLIDEAMKARDIGARNPGSTTHVRLDAMSRRLDELEHPIALPGAEHLLGRPPVCYERTLAAMAFVPSAGTMSIWFKGDAAGVYRRHSTHPEGR